MAKSQPKTMKIKILRACVGPEGKALEKGQEYTLPRPAAMDILGARRGEPVGPDLAKAVDKKNPAGRT